MIQAWISNIINDCAVNKDNHYKAIQIKLAQKDGFKINTGVTQRRY